MPEMKELTFSFANKGIVQKLDPSVLTEGQFYSIENLRSHQEGSLSVRRGATRKATIPGSLVHSIYLFRSTSTDKYMYIGEGTDIYRLKVGTWWPAKVASYSGKWGARWSAVPYFTGESGTPHVFIAAGNNMYKDTGTLSTLQKWGIDEPSSAAVCTVLESTPITIPVTGMSVTTSSVGTWSAARYIFPGTVDLSEGGDPDDGYNSKDPIRISVYVGRADCFSEIRIFLSVGDTTFVNRYEKSIKPSSLSEYLKLQQSAAEAAKQVVSSYDAGISGSYSEELPEEGVGIMPAEMKPSDMEQPFTDTISIPKNEWLKVGLAGSRGYDWSNVKAIYMLVQSAVEGYQVSIQSAGLYGRYGPDNSGSTDSEYLYVYTYKNSQTGHESAPSPIQTSGVWANRQRVMVRCVGSSDRQVHTIVVYRNGGLYADEFYRKVGEVSNSYGYVYFYDDKSDIEIESEPTAEFDNFPPPPARLCCHAFDSLFVAGIEEYPHVLAKSKTGRPESFPIVNEATNAAHRINVGSPSNPIMAITEFGGSLVCLNLTSIYVVGMWLGSMKEPVETPSQRGLIAEHAWCIADNEIWFLSYDGVYSWSGGQSIHRSLAIDWMFKGETVNGIPPIDLSDNGKRYISFAFYNNAVWISCKNTSGAYIVLIADMSTGEPRWHIMKPCASSGGALVTFLVSDPSESVLYSARSINYGGSTTAYIYQEDTGAQDDSSAISYSFRTGWITSRSYQMAISDILLELANTDTVLVKLYADYSAEPLKMLYISSTGGRRRIPIPITDGNYLPSSSEIYSIAIEVSGIATGATNFYSYTLNLAPLAQIQRGRTEDWDDLGYPYDKRLDQITFQYDAKGGEISAYLDIIYGTSGNLESDNVQTFSLTGSGRSQPSFAIKTSSGDWVVAKMVRLRYIGDGDYCIYGRNITFEKYPPDIVRFTEPNDWGTPYLKYFQQLTLDVDTGGVNATVNVIIDGSVAQTLTVNTTSDSRRVTYTLLPNLSGYKAWIESQPGASGKFQLFSYNFVAAQADKGAVIHTFDWDDLGHPYDKLLKSVSVEYEVTEDAVMNIDGLKGTTGAQETINITSISLRSGGRYHETFAMPVDAVVRMVRLYPQNTNVYFKSWNYTFDKENLPSDQPVASAWDIVGWPYEKILRAITIEADSYGESVSYALECDGASAFEFEINTQFTDRVRIITPPSDVIGKMFRIVPLSSKPCAIYGITYDVLREPPSLTHWDSYEVDGGHQGVKVIKQMILEYICASPITLKFYTDNGRLLHTCTLPAHSYRYPERVLLPASSSVTGNRTRVFRFTLDSESTFKFYSDSSEIEYLPLTGQQRRSYIRAKLSEFIGPRI